MKDEMSIRERIERFLLFSEVFSVEQHSEIDSNLCNLGFYQSPASAKHHLAIEGGLAEHSLNVAINLVDLTHKMHLTWQRPESPYLIGLFHDLCKCDSYIKSRGPYDIEGHPYKWNDKTLFKGHGVKSVMIASTIMQLTEEEVACITYHMGAFTDKEEWSDYTNAIHKYPNVLWTHTADMMAAHIDEEGE